MNVCSSDGCSGPDQTGPPLGFSHFLPGERWNFRERVIDVLKSSMVIQLKETYDLSKPPNSQGTIISDCKNRSLVQ